MTATELLPRINHVVLCNAEDELHEEVLRERATVELLRQRAVELGLLGDHGSESFVEPDDATQEILEKMLEREVPVQDANDEEAQRYYEANKRNYVINEGMHVRHILFAVSPGVNVQALANQAQSVLAALQETPVDDQDITFAKAADKYSNCPSSQDGGDLGWLKPEDCAPEIKRALFRGANGQLPIGLHPMLIHSRYGFHIMEVLNRRTGHQLSFDEVRDAVHLALEKRSQITAMRQYMQLLTGQSDVRGIDLEAATSPLVQD